MSKAAAGAGGPGGEQHPLGGDFPWPGRIFEIYGAAADSPTAWGRAWQQGALSLSGEWQAFVGRRLKDDVSFLQRLGCATSPEQAWSAWAEFWSKAVEDYWREYATLSCLLSGCSKAAFAGLQQRGEAVAQAPSLPKAA
jgi:hypothetical protein